MPAQPMSNDTPTTAQPYADVLNRPAPARNATSDMPQIAAPAADPNEAVDNTETPADVADTSTPAPAAKADGEADGKPPIPGEGPDETPAWLKARITRETNKIRRAADEQTADLKATVAQLVETVTKLTAPPAPKEAQKPARADFADPDAYDEALIKWSEDRATAKTTQAVKAEQVQADRVKALETIRDTYKARVDEFAADHPDFDDVAYAGNVNISPPMTQAIIEAEDGPAIAYFLGENPEEAERISKLSPPRAVYEIGRISTKLAAPPPPPPPKKPVPITPIRARNNAGEKSPDEMSMAEYVAYRNAQAKAN